MIRFYWSKKNITEKCIENAGILLNCRNRQRRPRSRSKTSCRSSPRCPCRRTPSPPSSSCSCPRYCCKLLRWPLIQVRQTQKSPKDCSQVSWEARLSSPTPPFLDICKIHIIFYALSGAKPLDYNGFCILLLVHRDVYGAKSFCLMLSIQLARFGMV